MFLPKESKCILRPQIPIIWMKTDFARPINKEAVSSSIPPGGEKKKKERAYLDLLFILVLRAQLILREMFFGMNAEISTSVLGAKLNVRVLSKAGKNSFIYLSCKGEH